MAVSITTEPRDTGTLLVVSGEVDVSNASELRDAIDAALASGAAAVEVDLDQVPYIDSTGIGVLVAAAHEATEAGRTFAVHNPQHNVARVLEMLDVAGRLGVTSSGAAGASPSNSAA